MTLSYKELLAQRESLEQAIAQARQIEIATAIEKIRGIVAEYGLTAQDIFPSRAGKSGKRDNIKNVPMKYQDSASGQTWTGRGKAPKWLEGKDRSLYLIA
jgi:DNA-binding protein H-NS